MTGTSNNDQAHTLRLVKQASEVLNYLDGLPVIKVGGRAPPVKPQELAYLNNNDDVSLLSVPGQLSPVHNDGEKTATQCFYDELAQNMQPPQHSDRVPEQVQFDSSDESLARKLALME